MLHIDKVFGNSIWSLRCSYTKHLRKMYPSSLGWTTMQHIKSRMHASDKGSQTHWLIGEAKSELGWWCVGCCCPHWWIMNVLPALFRPVSPTPLKLCPGEVWRMELVSIYTHRHTGEAVWSPGRGNKGRETSGSQSCCATSPAHSGLEKCQGSTQQVMVLAVPHCISYWVPASSAGALAFWTHPYHWNRAGAALSCTHMNTLVLGWWLLWEGNFGLLLSCLTEHFVLLGTWTFVPIKHFNVEFVEKTFY